MTPKKADVLHVIYPNAVYRPESIRTALGLAKGTLGREIRLGRLRASKRAGRYYVLGAWLLEWLEGGEVRRKRPVVNAAVRNSDANPN